MQLTCIHVHVVPIKIQTEAKNSNKLCISYSTKAVKVTINSTVLLLVRFCYLYGNTCMLEVIQYQYTLLLYWHSAIRVLLNYY